MAASREEVFERVKEVLTEQLGIEEADITEEASFQEDLDADSLDLVELIMELEDQFGIKISHELYSSYPDFSEGRLAKIRSHVVSRASCAVVARELDLGARLLGQGGEFQAEEIERLSKNRNVLAALLEAALGALFLEHGFPAIEDAVVNAFAARIEYALNTHVDHKTELQEAVARRGRQVSYVVLSAEGPPHERRFTCAAVVGGEQLGVGEGESKKAAEQEAAREALATLAAEPGGLGRGQAS